MKKLTVVLTILTLLVAGTTAASAQKGRPTLRQWKADLTKRRHRHFRWSWPVTTLFQASGKILSPLSMKRNARLSTGRTV